MKQAIKKMMALQLIIFFFSAKKIFAKKSVYKIAFIFLLRYLKAITYL